MRILVLAVLFSFGLCESVRAFCGFYVSTGDTPFNDASKVVLTRRGARTAITMSSDVNGEAKDFAVVIPVPTTIQRDQVRVIQSATVDHLDSYSTPRLVEYFDEDPCPPPESKVRRNIPFPMAVPAPSAAAPAGSLGVRVEAQYSVGEYDIQVLSARDSTGLTTYLNSRNYRIPSGAGPVIESYLKQRMQFFVAKVNLGRLNKGAEPNTKATFLRPLQVEYESPKFMLPIRLGTVNARGPQDMIVLALTQRGRVETTNYPTRRMPTGTNVPLYLKDDFAGFYRAVFDRQVEDAEGSATFLEYAWDMGQCDPCSAPPLSNDELHELGADWITRGRDSYNQPAFITRLHVRYDRAHFPEDLALQETADRVSYQARFVMNHPFTGAAACDAGKRYKAGLPARFRQEARNVVQLTDWSYQDVKSRMEAAGEAIP